jgi:hypothetical protein
MGGRYATNGDDPGIGAIPAWRSHAPTVDVD